MTDTTKTIQALSTVLGQPKNVKTFQKYLGDLGITDEEEYTRAVYQTVGDILQNKGGLKKVLKTVKKGKVGWNHPVFSVAKSHLEEHDDYLVNPFEVAEGIAECGECGSKRTFSCQRQVRGCDEPMTTFSRCAECGKTWTYSG